MNRRLMLPAILLIMILLASCAEQAPPAEVTKPAEATEAAAEPVTEPLVEVTETVPDELALADKEQAATDEQATDTPLATAVSPTTAPQPEPTEQQIEPIEVVYYTPPQGEGPYYPVNKLDDRDNDLTILEGADGSPVGEVIEFAGKVYDAAGMPLPGVVVEIWQTDSGGVYLHPGDPGTNQRDVNFQFYGESVTEPDGSYSFRTILPGHYEPRPRHIHVKVKFDGQELLTTQFYFQGDPELAGEPMFTQAGGDGEHLVINLEEGQDRNGMPILIGRRDVVLNMALSQ